MDLPDRSQNQGRSGGFASTDSRGHASEHASERRELRWFFTVFLALLAAFYALSLLPWIDARIFFPVMKVCAHGSSALLNLAGLKTIAEGVVIRGPGFAVAVRRGCDPLEPIVLFAAAVIAFPAAWRLRFIGLAIGNSFLFGLNLARIASLYLLGASKSTLFESFHLCWWPVFFIVCSLALWVLWLLWIKAATPGSKSDSPALPLAVTPRPRLPADSA